MSYTFLQEGGGEYSADTFLGIPASALSSGIGMPEACYSPDSEKARCRVSQSGMIFRRLTPHRGEEKLTLFAEGSHAKISAKLGAGQESMVRNQECGGKWREPLAKYDHDSFSWKTAQCSLFGGLVSCLETWPSFGTMRNGVCWGRTKLEHHTSEIASGYWPAPTTIKSKSKSTMNAKEASGGSVTLPTYPTPVASEGQDCGSRWQALARLDKGGRIQRRMATMQMLETKTTEKAALNPEWVEWLMAWPIGWTGLESLETGRFRRWWWSHGER